MVSKKAKTGLVTLALSVIAAGLGCSLAQRSPSEEALDQFVNRPVSMRSIDDVVAKSPYNRITTEDGYMVTVSSMARYEGINADLITAVERPLTYFLNSDGNIVSGGFDSVMQTEHGYTTKTPSATYFLDKGGNVLSGGFEELTPTAGGYVAKTKSSTFFLNKDGSVLSGGFEELTHTDEGYYAKQGAKIYLLDKNGRKILEGHEITPVDGGYLVRTGAVNHLHDGEGNVLSEEFQDY